MQDLIETVVARYTGEPRLQRLVAVARQARAQSNHGLCAAAVQAWEQAARADGNLVRYRELAAWIESSDGNNNDNNNNANNDNNSSTGNETTTLPPPPMSFTYDAAWVEQTEAQARQDRGVLRHRLQSVQSHLHKEAIRAAYLQLAAFDAQAGEVLEALHSVLRAKDYCTSRHNTTTVCLQIVHFSLLLGNAATAKEYVLRLAHTVGNDTNDSTAVQQDIETASGVERLVGKDYTKAAQHFAAVCKMGLEPSGTAQNSTVISPGTNNSPTTATTLLAPEDVALYAGILALATASAADMVALAEHPEALELVPPLRQALVLFGRRCQFQDAWDVIVQHYWPTLRYDLYLAPHWTQLQTMICEKAVATYWKAHERVALDTMATELGPGLVPSAAELPTLLVQLIRHGRLPQARLDLATRTLHRDVPPTRRDRLATRWAVVTQTTLEDTYATLTRLACLEHDLVVTGGRRRTGRARGEAPSYLDDVVMLDDDDDVQQAAEEAAEPQQPDMDTGDDMNPEDLY